MSLFIALLSGLVFGFGLAVSGMIDPARVQGFLDLAGQWDPTLAFVMGGGLLVNIPAWWLTRRRAQPLCAASFALPAKQHIDAPLLVGAASFGISWGLGGFCPGPALASLTSGAPAVLLFCLTMLAGMAVAEWPSRRGSTP